MTQQVELVNLVCWRTGESSTDEIYIIWDDGGKNERIPDAYWSMSKGDDKKLDLLKPFPQGYDEVRVAVWDVDDIGPDDCYGHETIYKTDKPPHDHVEFKEEGGGYTLHFKIVDI